MISGSLLIVAAVGYLIASVFYGAQLFKQHVSNRATWLAIARISGVVGLIANTAAIGVHCANTHHTPFTTSPESLSATGWAIAGIYLATELLQWRKPPTPVGAFAFPLAFLALVAGANMNAFIHRGRPTSVGLDNQLVSLHVMAILASYAMVTLAACCGALYLIEHRLLKRKEVASGLFARIPPLATLDHLSFTLISLAVMLLTLGLAAGEVSAYTAHQSLFDCQAAVCTVSWAILTAYLVLHSSRIAVGVRGNYFIFAGLIVALLTFFVPSRLHHFS